MLRLILKSSHQKLFCHYRYLNGLDDVDYYLRDKFQKIGPKFVIRDEKFNKLSGFKQKELVMEVAPTLDEFLLRKQFEIETRRVPHKADKELKRVEPWKRVNTDGKVPASPQSILDDGFNCLERGDGYAAAEAAWKSASLQLRLFLESYNLEADNHNLKSEIVGFLARSCEYDMKHKLNNLWTIVETSHRGSYTDAPKLNAIESWLVASSQFSNLIYDIYLSKSFSVDKLVKFALKSKNNYNDLRKLIFLNEEKKTLGQIYRFPGMMNPQEFIMHLLDKTEDSFRFLIVNRFVDKLSGSVGYLNNEEIVLSLQFTLDECQDSPFHIGVVNHKMAKLTHLLNKAFSDNKMLGSLPEFLIIQIRRFTGDHERVYIDVEVDEVIDLSEYYNGKLEKDFGKFTLCSFVSHIGSIYSGHFVAHIKQDGDVWLTFNDTKISLYEDPPNSEDSFYIVYKRKL